MGFDRFWSQSCRESENRAYWLSRNQSILDRLLYERSSIICLQVGREVWVGNEEFVNMYERRLGDAGYIIFKLARTNNRGDGLLTAVHKEYFRVLNYRDLLFNDSGDRVAQLLHVESLSPFGQSRNSNIQQQILIGFMSSYDTAHQYTDSDADAHKWVSHRNHRGNICGVDFIWLLNPNKYRKPLKTSWNETVFGIIKLGLTGHPDGLSAEETTDLWSQADEDGNGVVDYGEFQFIGEHTSSIVKRRIWDPTRSGQLVDTTEERRDLTKGPHDHVIGFNVKNASWNEGSGAQ
ncbi:hypothetical protein QJS04_geneDACA001007 [Acorus gramineus]|uniref:EF-hand domain-containing protein n=1 Tax=Acorus gramineus TaxID=55184 RepID=A0AAV9ABG2_ACOGR|nr:hypothetical protein QJS04_geneDACA001007 [Acorus gramineus]